MGKFWRTVKKIVKKGWPTSSKHYPYAHKVANKLEKKHVGAKKYHAFNKWIAKHIPKGQLAGKTTRNGRVEVASIVPKKYRWELRFHEKTEYPLLKPRHKNE